MGPVSFGEWLERRRKAAGLTQEQLAGQLHCSVSALRKFEAEERRPSEPIVEQLAEIFNIVPTERPAFLKFARGDWQAAPTLVATDAPWRATRASPRSKLPASTTSLIGRDSDIAALSGHLAQADIRLVTLIGPPGIGKTRLSIAAAREALSYFPDGVFFVALAPLDQADLVAPTIMQMVDFVETGHQSPLGQLTDGIGDKHLLLVLDNVEHLVEGIAPLVSDLLSACPQLKILTTSREALHVPGEWLYPVPALNVPTAIQLRSLLLAEAAQFTAVQLFAERARAVQPDFALNTDNLPTVAAICARLDGLPLAIELIAARMRLMSLPTLLERLNAQFVLAANGMRAVSTRQKTLHNAIAWSYNLLSAEERSLFAHLSVFAGGFTLKAAEAIFSSMFVARSVQDLIVSLLDKSLLQRAFDREARGETRFTMLETIREYALVRLREAGESETLRARHRDYYFQLVRQGDASVNRRDEGDWLNRIEADSENVRAALAYSVEQEDFDESLNALEFLQWLWVRRGYLREGAEWYRRVLPQARTDTPLYAQGLVYTAELARGRGDIEQADVLLTRALEWAQTNDNQQALALALQGLGQLKMYHGNLPLAREYLQESQRILLEVHAEQPPIGEIYLLAEIEARIGDPSRARQLWEEGLTFARKLENGFLMGLFLIF